MSQLLVMMVFAKFFRTANTWSCILSHSSRTHPSHSASSHPLILPSILLIIVHLSGRTIVRKAFTQLYQRTNFKGIQGGLQRKIITRAQGIIFYNSKAGKGFTLPFLHFFFKFQGDSRWIEEEIITRLRLTALSSTRFWSW